MKQTERTFTLVGIIVFLLLIMHQLPSLSIDGTDLRHVNILSDLIKSKNQEGNVDVIPKPQPPKSLIVTNSSGKKVEFKEIIPKGVTMIEDYSDGNSGGMDHFYEMLSKAQQLNRPVRIAYFGDSFIEGDIMTCDLREQLQQAFGGEGTGWVDCGSMFNNYRRTITQKYSGIKEFSVVEKPFNKQVQALNQRYFIPSSGAKITTNGTSYKPHCAQWQNALLYFRTNQPMNIATSINGTDGPSMNVGGSSSVQMIASKGNMHSIGYSLSSVGSGTYLYGVALESAKGVILDNFSMRGSAGFTIANVPQQTMNDFARLRPYDLIIIHFGLNVANAKNTNAIYKAYTDRMAVVISELRKAYPEASILVVSVPDRDQRTADGITTMHGIEQLGSYQRLLASKSKVAFFDIFKAMGGKGSMKKMVDKGWANKDYTHLSFAGGKVLAGDFYKSIKAGFDNYKRRKAYENE